MNNQKDFIKGMRVRLSEKVLHPEFSGLSGTVVKVVKSRGLIVVSLDDGRKYDAYPENVIKEEGCNCEAKS